MATCSSSARSVEAEMLATRRNTPRTVPRIADTTVDLGPQGSPMKAVWELRRRQVEEVTPSVHSLVKEVLHRHPQAVETTSYRVWDARRTKHIRNVHGPSQKFVQALSTAQECGWHSGGDEQGNSARGSSTPRFFYPITKCHMTKQVENMYVTCAINIVRQ
mmetsp:Transcript_63002/g.136797  ORF Transcript_63002/g.136797 Transcript_63002/m.136797 type:complete len:161 (+) Transcript_63002:80-562(+)|eukprot:CAMPEP_0170610260 /NCGR_PEP_ID=MMETSP0224-20130122/22561_1 /TAXON_ID=285029 /ORGANISM="Togula jolla, Strain CCCM 725" /LENGTH=160 /DNA_ID=CAMNT_0010935617 /DNA_START=78 /DNA_END=560 /DNA_ORIENTATION=-